MHYIAKMCRGVSGDSNNALTCVVTSTMLFLTFHVAVSCRPLSTQRVSSWLQGLCWQSGTQRKQEWVGENVRLLWSLEKCLGGQEPTGLCLRGVWRLSRCIWCRERTGWKVNQHFSVIAIILSCPVFYLVLHLSCDVMPRNLCGMRVRVELSNGEKRQRSRIPPPSWSRRPREDFRRRSPQARRRYLPSLPNFLRFTFLFYSQSHLLMFTSEYENIWSLPTRSLPTKVIVM